MDQGRSNGKPPAGPQPRWVERDKAWVVPLGSYNPKFQRYRDVTLRDPQGRKVARDDHAGKIAALNRLLQERELARRASCGPTVADIVEAYLAWHKQEGSADRTITDHARWLTKFGDFEDEGVAYCDRAADSIGLKDLSRIRKAMEADGGSGPYIRHLYMSVRACFAWAARPVEDREPERFMDRDPFERLQVPSAGPSDEKFVDPAVTLELIRYVDRRATEVKENGLLRWSRYAVAFKLIALAGCRPKEAAELRRPEIDWTRDVIVIPYRERRVGGRRHKTGKKTGKPRVFAIPREVREELATIDGDELHPEFVFWTDVKPTSAKLAGWFREVREGARKEGIAIPEECTLYWFRHTWQTIGVGVETVERVALAAGNSPQVVVSTYVSAQARLVREVWERVVQEMKACETAGQPKARQTKPRGKPTQK